MNFDRGFIKWQPFNSVAPSKTILKNAIENKKVNKPTLFPEEIEILNEEIMEAYYSQDEIELTYYEENTIKKMKTKIKKIDVSSNIIYLTNKAVSFSQITEIKFIFD